MDPLNSIRFTRLTLFLFVLGLAACSPEPEYGIDIYFVHRSEFSALESNYQPSNDGFFWVDWNNAGWIQHANILLATDISQALRNHLIREEITQSLGLMNDSPRFPASIFYSGESYTTAYLPLDQRLISRLYQEAIEPSLTLAEVTEIISQQLDQDDILYFHEIAFVSEFGEQEFSLHKWPTDIPLRIHGNPTKQDLVELEQVISEINLLLGNLDLFVEAPDDPGD